MKKLLLSFCLSIGTLFSYGQITLEHTFSPAGIGGVILFSSNGTKLMINDTGTNQIKIYNIDYSIWKTISIPVPTGYKLNWVQYVSDNLFNSDNSVELIVSCTKSISTYPYLQYSMFIVNESGSNILDLGEATSASVQYVEGTYKLIVSSYQDYYVKYYSLPGTLPCGHCGAMGVPKLNNNTASVSAPVPNPASGTVQIAYTLPEDTHDASLVIFNNVGQTLRTYPINPLGNNISIDVSTLRDGIYYYSITGDAFAPVGGTFVK